MVDRSANTRPPGIGLATLDDALRVAQTHVRARRSAYRDLIPAEMLAAERAEDREGVWIGRLADREGRCWLLEGADGLLGFAHTAPASDEDLGPDCAELFALYLLPEAIGRGLGRELATHALVDVAERGFSEIVLWYAEENLVAARFYAAAGFTRDPRVCPAPYGATGLTRRRLRRGLAP